MQFESSFMSNCSVILQCSINVEYANHHLAETNRRTHPASRSTAKTNEKLAGAALEGAANKNNLEPLRFFRGAMDDMSG
jgi:hypothetical protein